MRPQELHGIRVLMGEAVRPFKNLLDGVNSSNPAREILHCLL